MKFPFLPEKGGQKYEINRKNQRFRAPYLMHESIEVNVEREMMDACGNVGFGKSVVYFELLDVKSKAKTESGEAALIVLILNSELLALLMIIGKSHPERLAEIELAGKDEMSEKIIDKLRGPAGSSGILTQNAPIIHQ